MPHNINIRIRSMCYIIKLFLLMRKDKFIQFIQSALAPARVREVQLNEEEGIATVIVHDQQLSLAIGKEGQNARLAARLTGWRIDIRSENEGEVEVVEEVWTEEGVVVDETVVEVHDPHAHDGEPITEVFTDGVTLVEETVNVARDGEGHEVHVEQVVVMDEDGAELEVLEVDVTEDEA